MAHVSVRRHYMLTLRLDLAGVDEVFLREVTEGLRSVGVAASTLREEQNRRPDALRNACVCHNECSKRQPPVELRQEPIPFDRWMPAFPDLYFVAVHAREYVGVCRFDPLTEQPDTLESGFTGVLPAWGGRGVAKALKARGLLEAKRRGFRFVETHNLLINRGMCAINRALGFQIVRKHLHSYPIPAA